MEECSVYPIITLPKGQFTLVDGFLIHLSANKLNSHLAEDVETIFEGESSFFQDYTKYNTMSKMEKIGGNFFLTGHSLFFYLMGAEEYVSFVKTKDRYYCRKCDKKRASHVAFAVKLSKGRKRFRTKYIVFDKSLGNVEFDLSELYKQQNRDLDKINYAADSSIKKDPPFNGTILGHPNVKFISEREFIHAVELPIREKVIHTKRQYARIRKEFSSLNNFKNQLLLYCKKRSLWKLKKLLEVLRYQKETIGLFGDIDALYNVSEKQILSNLKLLVDKVLPTLLKHEMKQLKSMKQEYMRKDSYSDDCANAHMAKETETFLAYNATSLSQYSRLNEAVFSSQNFDFSQYFLHQVSIFCSYSEQKKLFIRSFIEAREEYMSLNHDEANISTI